MTEPLKPKFENCVSYWNRAHVERFPLSGAVVLKSYDTYVCFVDAAGRFHRTWGGWSRTTSRHVVEFWRQFCNRGPVPCKRAWEAMPVEDLTVARDVASALVSMEAKP